LSARVLEYIPAAIRPFDSVKADIEKLLKSREAAVMAKKSGEEKLTELKGGSADKLVWSQPKTVSRNNPGEVPSAVMQALFKADIQKLPVYAGAAVNNAYSVVKVVKVNQPEKLDPAKRKGLQAEYASIVAQEDLSAFMSGLRQRYKIEVNKAALESRDR